MANRNLLDPAEQEKIRRGIHTYKEGDGRHGLYVKAQYHHQEYPRVMDTTPAPKFADFKGQPNAEILYETAQHEWDDRQRASIVNDKDAEQAWIEAHKDDPKPIPFADRRYPKTMDKTPAPASTAFDNLEDFRAARDAWKEQVKSSIVHDADEEELYLRQHSTEPPKPKGKKSKAA